jgi:hypothetical protein
MEANQGIPRRFPVLLVSLIVSAIALLSYILIYYFAPFSSFWGLPERWDTLAIYLYYPPFALFAAITGTLLLMKFSPGEPPHRIWLLFILGWWTWVVGEVIDLIVTFADIPYGELTISDICWSIGYLFFGLALYFQIRNIMTTGQHSKGRAYVIFVIAALLVTAILTQLAIRAGLGKDILESSGPKIGWFSVFLAIFYPVFDISLGVAAIWLSVVFRGSRWGHPWMGLISFAIADAISAYIWMGGIDHLSDYARNIIWMISDSFYVAGYLIVGLGFLSVLTLFSSIEASD